MNNNNKKENKGKYTGITNLFSYDGTALSLTHYTNQYNDNRLIVKIVPRLDGDRKYDFLNNDINVSFMMTPQDIIRYNKGMEYLNELGQNGDTGSFSIQNLGGKFKNSMRIGNNMEDLPGELYVHLEEFDNNLNVTRQLFFVFDAPNEMTTTLNFESTEESVTSEFNSELFDKVLNSALDVTSKSIRHSVETSYISGGGGGVTGRGGGNKPPVLNRNGGGGRPPLGARKSASPKTITSKEEASKIFQRK